MSDNKTKSWKERLYEMKEGEEISSSILYRDNTFGFVERLRKLSKQGYLKYVGINSGTITFKRTNKQYL